MSATVHTATVQKGQVWAVQLFLLSLLVPFALPLGPILLMPHRMVLLVLFVPFFLMLFVLRRAGPVILADWLLLGAAIWGCVSLMANHPFGVIVEPVGIHMLEFFGAYLLARIGIRSGDDFRRMVRTAFFMILILLPFAAAESLTRRPILLDLLPGTNTKPVDAGVRMGLRRAQTVFAHPIHFGIFASTGLGLFWYAIRPRWLRFPSVPIVAMATVFSLSTGALISFVVQTAFIGWEMVLKSLRRRWMLFTAMAIGGYVLIDLLSDRTPFHVLVTYGSLYQGSAYGRIVIWQNGIDDVWANPIFGLGMREWTRPFWLGSSVDNFWLYMTMRHGLPFFAMFAAAVAVIVRRVALTSLSDPDDRLARAGALVALGGLVVAGGTVHFWHAMQAYVMFIFGAGVWVATGGGRAPSDPDAETEAPDRQSQAPRRSRYTRQPGLGVPIPGSPVRPASTRAAGRSQIRRG